MLQRFKHIKVVDVNYCNFKNISASYIIRAPNKETMIVDTGTPKQFPLLKKALKQLNVKREEVTKILLTHFHMDHSGGTSLLTRNYPNAIVYGHPLTLNRVCHPKGICLHMSKVLRSNYTSEFGDNVLPIPERRCKEVKDNEIINFANFMNIKVLYTPGHTKDHVVYHDLKDSLVFTGDAFGNQYGAFTRPVFSCPYLFDSYLISKSIDKVIKSGAKTGAQSHFAYIDNIADFGEKAKQWAQRMGQIAIESKHPRFEVYAEYAKHFGSNFYNNKIIRGHYFTNVMGTDSVYNFVHGIPDRRSEYMIY